MSCSPLLAIFNQLAMGRMIFAVVICFRFVSLKYQAQPHMFTRIQRACCDLLSICIFEISSTTFAVFGWNITPLWFAFDLYLWNIKHNPFNIHNGTKAGCDLLSICIFEISSTTIEMKEQEYEPLWFAFDLYLWNIKHNGRLHIAVKWLVVICFRFVSLKYQAQQASKC